MLDVTIRDAAVLDTSHRDKAVVASMTNTIATRGTNAGGGGPMNFIANRPATTTAPQPTAMIGACRSRSPNRACSIAASHSASAARVMYRTTITR